MCVDGGTPSDVEEDDGNGFTTTDNDDESPTGPDDRKDPDDTVPIFDDQLEDIPKGPNNYKVTIETPENTDDIPMEIDVPTTVNVGEVVVYVDGVEVDRVSYK